MHIVSTSLQQSLTKTTSWWSGCKQGNSLARFSHIEGKTESDHTQNVGNNPSLHKKTVCAQLRQVG